MSRVLVTRPAAQAAELVALLEERGVEGVAVPTVEIRRVDPARGVDAALEHLAGAAWLIVTSANGASILRDRLMATGSALPPGLRVAAVGPATAEVLSGAGLRVDHVPEDHLTVAIAGGLGDVRSRRVVLLRADLATPQLPDELRARGAKVEEVVAYRIILSPPGSRDPARDALRAGLDGISFTSPSTVRGLRGLLNPVERGLASTVPAFCIGPVTESAARHAGFAVVGTAEPHTAAGLADAIARHFATRRRS